MLFKTIKHYIGPIKNPLQAGNEQTSTFSIAQNYFTTSQKKVLFNQENQLPIASMDFLGGR